MHLGWGQAQTRLGLNQAQVHLGLDQAQVHLDLVQAWMGLGLVHAQCPHLVPELRDLDQSHACLGMSQVLALVLGPRPGPSA